MIFKKIKNYIKSTPSLFFFAKTFLPILIWIKLTKKKTFELIDKKTNEQKLMINIGGGHFFRRHWRVMDFSSKWYHFRKGIIDYEFDLASNDSFPIKDNSVSFFYSSHTLEHIPQECCQHIMNEIFRCLKVGGAVRITVPDFDLAYKAFLSNSIDFFSIYSGGTCIEEKFLEFFATYLKGKVCYKKMKEKLNLLKKETFADYYTGKIPREFQRIFAGNHINWWNYEKLFKMLAEAGFKVIYRSGPQKSRFIEMRGFGWNSGFDTTHPKISLFIEAIK